MAIWHVSWLHALWKMRIYLSSPLYPPTSVAYMPLSYSLSAQKSYITVLIRSAVTVDMVMAVLTLFTAEPCGVVQLSPPAGGGFPGDNHCFFF